jgi:hypothetical protein
MGAAMETQVRSDTVSVAAFSHLTSQDVTHQATCSCASVVRDEEQGSGAFRSYPVLPGM